MHGLHDPMILKKQDAHMILTSRSIAESVLATEKFVFQSLSGAESLIYFEILSTEYTACRCELCGLEKNCLNLLTE